MPTDTDLPVRPGTIVAGKYEVQRLLGEGGIGVVYAARHIRLNRDVALKFLKPGAVEASLRAELFANEARATFDIVNAHIVRVLDLDRLPDDTPFMVMELLDGCDLRKLMDDHQRIDLQIVVEIGRQICNGLIAAHARGIVHRDIKPENIFVMGARLDGEVELKLLDFGISRVSEVEGDAKAEQLVSGTPAYMSPEQVSAASQLDQRSDVWSLGCVLYEMATGIAPFQRATPGQSCHAVLEEDPAPLRAARPEIDRGLEQIVLRCLHKQASERFASARELKNALDQLPRAAASAELAAPARSRKQRVAWIAASIVVLAMLAFLWSDRLHPKQSVVRPVALAPADVIKSDRLPSAESESQLAMPALRPVAKAHDNIKRKPKKKSLEPVQAQTRTEPDVGF